MAEKKSKSKIPKPKLNIVKGKSGLARTLMVPSLHGRTFNPDKVDVLTYRKMRKDYQISACLNVWSFSLRKVDWYLEGGDKEIREKIEKSLQKIWTKVIKVVSKSLWAGYSPSTKEFTFDEELGIINIKTLRDLSPESCYPKIDENGDFQGFFQRQDFINSSNKDVEISPLYAFWFPNMMIDGNLYGESMIKGAYNPWYYSELVHLFANRYYERFGEPLVKGRAPGAGAVPDKDGTIVDPIAEIQNIGENLKSHSVATLPSDRDDHGELMYDIEYLESNMRGVDFGMYLSRLDMEKCRAIFVPDLLLGTGRVGSFELGKEHKATFLQAVQGMFDDITEYVQKYIIDQLVGINYPDGTEIPKFRHLPLSPVDQDTIAKIIQEASKGGEQFIDVKKLAQRIGIPILDAEELAEANEARQDEKIDPDIEDVKNRSVIQNQYNRVSKYVTNTYKSSSKDEDKLRLLESTKIGYIENYNKDNFDIKRWRDRQKQVRDYLVDSFNQRVSLDIVINGLRRVMCLTTAEEYFKGKSGKLADQIKSVIGDDDAKGT